MDKDLFGFIVMMITMGVIGVFCGVLLGSDSADKRVVNQLCSKNLYDFCEVDTYKMKGK